ncbi:MAG TPA: GntR family transcriptional regulator [Ilumatobacter sp.]|nr:GntR family transcriptional regulator [Ilumatobacter sp.]
MTDISASTHTGTSFQRPPTTGQTVVSTLRRDIVDGVLRPGAWLRQSSLAEQLGVSRAPLREAFRILEGEGLVVSVPRRGYQVRELSLEDLEEIVAIRSVVESEALRLGVARLTADDLHELRDLYERMADPEIGAAESTRLHHRFHFLVFERSGMPLLMRYVEQYWRAGQRYRSLAYGEADDRRWLETAKGHADLLAACEARDAEAVVQAMHAHRTATVQVVTSVLERGSSG